MTNSTSLNSGSSRQMFNARMFFFVLCTGFAVISFVGLGLQVCGWLDIRIGYTGCYQSLVFDRESIQSVAYSPDGQHVAIGGSAGVVYVYDINSNQGLTRLEGHTNWISSLTFSPDGSLLASGSWDGTVRIWSMQHYRVIHTLSLDAEETTIRVKFSPDGNLLATSAYRKPLRLWNTATGTLQKEVQVAGSGIAFSHRGAQIALEEVDGVISIQKIADGTRIASFKAHRFNISDMAFSADDAVLYSSSASEAVIKAWDVASGMLLQAIPASARADLIVSPQGEFLVTGGMDRRSDDKGVIEVATIGKSIEMTTWPGHRTLVNSVALSPDGRSIVTGSSWETVRFWRLDKIFSSAQ